MDDPHDQMYGPEPEPQKHQPAPGAWMLLIPLCIIALVLGVFAVIGLIGG